MLSRAPAPVRTLCQPGDGCLSTCVRGVEFSENAAMIAEVCAGGGWTSASVDGPKAV